METPNSGQRFTTVGSIYIPQATPLQPPARRGRHIKWQPHPDLAMPRSSLSGYPFRGQSDSPPLSVTRPPHYSPLQQNYDRAVSPIGSAISMKAPALPAASSLSASSAAFGKHNAVNVVNQAAAGDDVVDDENLQKMSAKSLTNLASYPNPMQKNAQKVLSRARNTPLANTRTAPSDPFVLASLIQSDGADDHDFQYRRAKDSSYSTILSKGLGAPQPLTAGPPGLRQHKSSIFDYATLDRQRLNMNEDTATHHQNALQMAPYQYRYPLKGVQTPSFRASGVASDQSAISMDKSAWKIRDTLTAEEARQLYYPHGLPTNFNYQSFPDTLICHPLQESGLCKTRSQDDMDSHQAMVDKLFYAGNEMLNKSIDEAIAEKNCRDFERTMGITSENQKQNKGKIINRKLTIQEANSIPTSDHAVPLLSILFQTLINHPSLSGDSTMLRKECRDD